MKTLRIGTREVGEGRPVYIVAELSANHGANKDVALRTVEAAAKAGADAIKLQTYTPDTMTLASTSDQFVVRTKNEWAGRTLHDLYAEAMTPWEWHAELKDAAEANGLQFFSTPFDVTAVEFLETLGVLVHKIASFELTDLPLVDHVARRGHPMILSTGMASLGEIEEAVLTCRAAGNDQLALLRCVSAYPAAPEAMGLASLQALASFGTVVGLSDHSRDATAAVAAVALGAKIVGETLHPRPGHRWAGCVLLARPGGVHAPRAVHPCGRGRGRHSAIRSRAHGARQPALSTLAHRVEVRCSGRAAHLRQRQKRSTGHRH